MIRYQEPAFVANARGVGGGAPPMPAQPIDPRGIVPVNRTQPLATDGDEVQRMTERRMATMPPASFSGAGANFDPNAATRQNALARKAADYAVLRGGDWVERRAQIANGTQAGPPLVSRSMISALRGSSPQAQAAIRQYLDRRNGLLGV